MHPPFADLTEEDLATKPSNWTGKKEKKLDLVKGARLKGVNLQNASSRRAFLVNADLREANLQTANLEGANLEGANLREAKNLTIEQLSKVKTLYGVKNLDSELMEQVKKDCCPLI